MSISRFLKSFALMLFVPLLTCAAAHGEPLRWAHSADTNHYLTDTKETGKTTSAPVKLEKFILRVDERPAPDSKDTVDPEAKDKPDDARASDKIELSGKANLNLPEQPLFTSSNRRLSLIDKTYLDAFAILQDDNTCSRFFGGPRIATGVLNSLHPRLKKTSLAENPAGIAMFGSVTTITNFQTGARYRLFENSLVNQAGPFYQSVNYQSKDYFHHIGHFSANTREARVTMLLHELGHLLQGPDGRWLLPDDGGDQVQSTANTMTIMNRCSEQIKSLSLQRTDTPRLEASAQTEGAHLLPVSHH